MDKQETIEKVKEIVADHFGFEIEEVEPGTNFTTDLGSDSLDVIELVVSFEEEFDIEILDDEVEKITTVSDAIDCVIAAH